MTKATRPSLTSLADRMTKKPSAQIAAERDMPDAAPAVSKGEAKDTRVQVMARMTPGERKSLRRIALEQDTTVQALIEEAIRDLLSRHDGK